MLKEFIQEIAGQAVRAAEVKILKTGNVREVMFVNPADGKLCSVPVPPAPREHSAHSIEHLAAFVKEFKSEPSGGTHIWYDRNNVVALLDNTDRLDTVTFGIENTDQLAAIMTLAEERKTIKQKDLSRFLRVDLHGCQGQKAVIESIQRLKWGALKAAEEEQGRSKVSVGRTITAELSGAESVPEQIVLDVPIWQNCPCPMRAIAFALEIVPESESFMLIPLPGQIEQAVRSCEDWLGKRIVELLDTHECGVYYGQP